jgi:hypothetical protein
MQKLGQSEFARHIPEDFSNRTPLAPAVLSSISWRQLWHMIEFIGTYLGATIGYRSLAISS